VPSATRKLLVDHAPAKVNLTLAVMGRRADGYHLLESIVVFAGVGDRLTFKPGGELALIVRGAGAEAAGPIEDNLVIRAARALAAEVPGLKLGRFTLTKHLPVAAGVGGGSSDAAAALRLLARANRLKLDDRRLYNVGRAIGADVPVCIDPRPRTMKGIGDKLSSPLKLPSFPAVMINPGVALPTRDVFTALHQTPWKRQRALRAAGIPRARKAFAKFLESRANDLEPPAMSLRPAIAEVLEALRDCKGCHLARMSGSGATCFGLFASPRDAKAAARKIAAAHKRWWVRATVLG
jgi:4-diphosphocytidyl-2-C-methyl-D-erythritol kinase